MAETVAQTLFWLIVLAFWVALVRFFLRKRSPDTDTPVLPPTTEILVWCQGCKCRHRETWMRWTDSGAYLCVVCCRDKETAAL